MKKPKAIMTTGTAEEFFDRVEEDFKALDRGELLKPEVRITFEDPADMMRAISSERWRLLNYVRMGTGKSHKFTLSGLAHNLKRTRAAVNRDVGVLENLGLLRSHSEPNPGHGKVKVVEPVAKDYVLTLSTHR